MNELFRTPAVFGPISQPISHSDHILMAGSCFSENIYRKLKQFRFNAESNPSGIVYNPLSISDIIKRVVKRRLYNADDLFHHDDLWKSFDHHSAFDNVDREAALAAINESLIRCADIAEKPDVLIITLGSSFVYELTDSGRIVANCHKLDNSRFKRRILSVNEICDGCRDMIDTLLKVNKNMRFIFTVSPVRHMRDSAHDNCVSKSHLITSIYELEQRYSCIYYFPAYEIMMDELRDYRFYAADMIHPSETAIEFIWDRFIKACMSEKSMEFMKSYEKIISARAHRIQAQQKEKIEAFAVNHLHMLDKIKGQFPDADLSDDYRYFRALAG